MMKRLDVFWRSPVDNVKIPRRERNTLQDCGRHSDHDDFDLLVNEPVQDFVKFGFFGCHDEF
jgi:hypothetical protein